MSLTIFNYEDPASYLRDAWNAKREMNPQFTLRSWSNNLGISSHGTFYQMVMGKRPLPKKYVKALSKSLNLNKKESLYLEILIDYSKAKSMELKSHYKEKLDDLAPGEKLSFYEIETFNYLKNPLNGAIIELTSLKDFCSDVDWIQKRLLIKASQNEIQKSIDLMLSLNLLTQDEDGRLIRSHEHIYTKQDVKNEALQEYHKNILELGSEMIKTQEVSKREYNATAFGIKLADLPEVKEDIREFLNHLIQKYETPHGQSEEIYQLGIQFFALSEDRNYH